jgi:hypothetical protein
MKASSHFPDEETDPGNRLAAIRMKFGWAARQAIEIESAIDAFVETADYTINLDIGFPWSSLSLFKVPPVPTDIRLLFADYVHNLRSVLNQIVWNLVDLNLEKESPSRSVAFPVVIDRSDWDDARKRQLRGFPEPWLDVIEWAQPFNVDPPSEHPAYFLHHLDIAGKHHRVVGFGLTLAQIPDPEILTNRPMGPHDRIRVIQLPGPFNLQPGEVLRRYLPISPLGDLRITGVGRAPQCQIVLGPYREDVGFPGGVAPMKNRNYAAYVGSVLEVLAPAFK